MGNESTTYEERARHAKASAIAGVFIAKGVEAKTLKVLADEGWITAAGLAGVRVPSEQTRNEIIERVESFAATKSKYADDPFAGFPKAGEFE
jgi:hypothetical protein